MDTEHGLVWVRRCGNWEWIGMPNRAELILHDGDDAVLDDDTDLRVMFTRYAPSWDVGIMWWLDVMQKGES